MDHKSLLAFIDRWVNALCNVRIEGQSNVPRSGTAIVAINHLGFLDPAVGYMAIRRPDLTGWVADKHKINPLYSYFIKSANGIWLDRENVDMQALRKALQALKDGRIFGLAPEGTRSPTHKMIQAKEGASYLAISSGAPVIPAGIWGTEDSAGDWLRLRKPNITLRIGKAFHLPPFNRETRQQDLQRGTDEIMCRIAALIPESYRGVYADHPRLKELLAEGADKV
jgi:1-acyl-sn-glycerol-3-phosphate acyltransferase